MTIAIEPPSPLADPFGPVIERMKRDIRQSAKLLDRRQARYLVDAYYQMQHDRIKAAAQQRAMEAESEPVDAIEWLKAQGQTLENRVKSMLDVYSASQPLGVWARSNKGVGPVISAGLLAHIDATTYTTVGHIWRFAGLDPTVTWGKGEKRPWNAKLKTLVAFKLGECFVKVSGDEKATYGRLYAERKALEVKLNESGANADTAARILEEKNFGEETEARKHYEDGKLPPAHVHARARRYVAKMFLAHYHYVAWVLETGEPPAKPYAIAHMDHADMIDPPNLDLAYELRKSGMGGK